VQVLPDYCFSHTLLRFGFLVEQPLNATNLKVRTLWEILERAGLSAGVIGWPLTYPATPLRGYLVSDAYSRLISAPSGIEDPATMYPPDLAIDAIRALDESGPVPMSPEGPRIESQRDGPVRVDRLYDRLADNLAQTRPTDVRVVRYQALDAIGHYFLRYARPREFGDVSEDERLRFGSVLEQQYGAIDEAIGRAILGLAPDDLLLVVSGYGMEPLPVLKRVLERMIGDPELSGTHEAAPDGFLMAYGSTINHARLPTRASLVDVVPTVLYFLGLPIGRDMDGYARTDLFQPSFTRDRPLTFIPSYDR
jgi:predicted AlkP superfamily phosphohydrolase/phosphomutase